jgi:hypothetical protein
VRIPRLLSAAAILSVPSPLSGDRVFDPTPPHGAAPFESFRTPLVSGNGADSHVPQAWRGGIGLNSRRSSGSQSAGPRFEPLCTHQISRGRRCRAPSACGDWSPGFRSQRQDLAATNSPNHAMDLGQLLVGRHLIPRFVGHRRSPALRLTARRLSDRMQDGETRASSGGSFGDISFGLLTFGPGLVGFAAGEGTMCA